MIVIIWIFVIFVILMSPFSSNEFLGPFMRGMTFGDPSLVGLSISPHLQHRLISIARALFAFHYTSMATKNRFYYIINMGNTLNFWFKLWVENFLLWSAFVACSPSPVHNLAPYSLLVHLLHWIIGDYTFCFCVIFLVKRWTFSTFS